MVDTDADTTAETTMKGGTATTEEGTATAAHGTTTTTVMEDDLGGKMVETADATRTISTTEGKMGTAEDPVATTGTPDVETTGEITGPAINESEMSSKGRRRLPARNS